ncbi:hypothetical protein [uncultured Secundilactobacillus sp.]|uniref:hypothetical protein n=1 Tax=uncultured Secundilactobacillus sp. TaxID=2813935 RepID=UPI0025905137|nr:hypothetical protein [uncultured Secundilactobacillus sp.]
MQVRIKVFTLAGLNEERWVQVAPPLGRQLAPRDVVVAFVTGTKYLVVGEVIEMRQRALACDGQLVSKLQRLDAVRVGYEAAEVVASLLAEKSDQS